MLRLPMLRLPSRKERGVKEIPFKQWRMEKAMELGLSESAVAGRLYNKRRGDRFRISYPKTRRVNRRVVFVQLP